MNDTTYEAVVSLESGRVYRMMSEHGVCDVSRSLGDDEGLLQDFSYDQVSPEEALDIAAELVKIALAAKNFHAATVDNLRAQNLNGAHADGEA